MGFAQARTNKAVKGLTVFLSKLILSQGQHLGSRLFLARDGKVALSKYRVPGRYPPLASLRPCHYDCRLVQTSLARLRSRRNSLLRQEIWACFHLRLQGNLFCQNSFVSQFWVKELILKLRYMRLA